MNHNRASTSGRQDRVLKPTLRATRNLAVLVILATLLSRVLAPALLGTRAGIGTWIDTLSKASGFVSQATVWICLFALVALLFKSMWLPELGSGYRLFILPTGAIVVVLVALATKHSLDARANLGLAWASTALALAAAPGAIGGVRTRTLGLMLGLAGIAGAIQAIGRSIVMNAEPHLLASAYMVARWLISLAFAVKLGVIFVLAGWLGRRNWPQNAVLLGLGALLSLVASMLAQSGSSVGAGFWEVLLARSFNELTRSPLPLVPAFYLHVFEAMTLIFAVLALLDTSQGRKGALAALILVSGSATDIPFYAAVLALTSLLTRLMALDEAPEPVQFKARQRAPVSQVH